jgi:hypothetical protein
MPPPIHARAYIVCGSDGPRNTREHRRVPELIETIGLSGLASQNTLRRWKQQGLNDAPLFANIGGCLIDDTESEMLIDALERWRTVKPDAFAFSEEDLRAVSTNVAMVYRTVPLTHVGYPYPEECPQYRGLTDTAFKNKCHADTVQLGRWFRLVADTATGQHATSTEAYPWAKWYADWVARTNYYVGSEPMWQPGFPALHAKDCYATERQVDELLAGNTGVGLKSVPGRRLWVLQANFGPEKARRYVEEGFGLCVNPAVLGSKTVAKWLGY